MTQPDSSCLIGRPLRRQEDPRLDPSAITFYPLTAPRLFALLRGSAPSRRPEA